MSKSSESLGAKAYDYILELIMSKELEPGARIPEQKIAQELSVSRTPVREAIKKLEIDGLVQIFQNRHAEVEVYDDSKILNAGTMRIALEHLAIKLARVYASYYDLLQLKEIAVHCKEAYLNGDDKLGRKYDVQFHSEIARLSRNDILIQFQKILSQRMEFILLYNQKDVSITTEHLEEHLQVADALLAQDEQAAITIDLKHLKRFYHIEESLPDGWLDSFIPIIL